jgi:hypothetical protein
MGVRETATVCGPSEDDWSGGRGGGDGDGSSSEEEADDDGDVVWSLAAAAAAVVAPVLACFRGHRHENEHFPPTLTLDSTSESSDCFAVSRTLFVDGFVVPSLETVALPTPTVVDSKQWKREWKTKKRQ